MSRRDEYDIFVCGGSQHVDMLQALLPRLRPYGFVHVASTFMAPHEEAKIGSLCDALHRPRYADVPMSRTKVPYVTFNLFCTREINRLASRPRFIKMDADMELADGWIDYVDAGFASHPDAAVFGNRRGISLNTDLSGPPVRQRLGRDRLVVAGGTKVCGPFYACRTDFFKQHDDLMQRVHELCWCFGGGRRRFPSPQGLPDTTGALKGRAMGWPGAEDGTRCLAVHAAGGTVLHLPSGGLIGQERC